MRLDRVTITGPDDSISPEDLVSLTMEFPFVEWGILVSANKTLALGSRRFPSTEWLRKLKDLNSAIPLPLSLHVCGQWVRQLLLGNLQIPVWLHDGWFQRMQLNFHAENTACNPTAFFNALGFLLPRQFIFQIDGSGGNEHLEALYAEADRRAGSIDAVALFDISGGAGILPAEWPKPKYMDTDVDYAYHGYAGGLGPDNLKQQIPLIAEAAGSARIWIDMETKVRSPDDRQFDLAKVRRCLEICAPLFEPVAEAVQS